MGNALSAILSYRLYDNWKKNYVFLNTPEDKEYERILKECMADRGYKVYLAQ
mgnify:CR=1 FL=1